MVHRGISADPKQVGSTLSGRYQGRCRGASAYSEEISRVGVPLLGGERAPYPHTQTPESKAALAVSYMFGCGGRGPQHHIPGRSVRRTGRGGARASVGTGVPSSRALWSVRSRSVALGGFGVGDLERLGGVARHLCVLRAER